MTDPWAAPPVGAAPWGAPPPRGDVLPAPRHDRRADVAAFFVTLAVVVLLGAPLGLLWSAIAPRLTVELTADGPVADGIETTKAFVGADGTFVLLGLAVGVLCGVLAWVLGRRYGPAVVLALAVGGLLGGLVAGEVGVRPGKADTLAALQDRDRRGTVELFLGKRDGNDLSLRAPWSVTAWPVGSLAAFFALGLRRPEELD